MASPFKANAEEERKALQDPQNAVTTARSLLYQEFPSAFTFNLNLHKWKLRQHGNPAIGRMYFVAPIAGDRFFVRLLLTVVRGPTSFEHL